MPLVLPRKRQSGIERPLHNGNVVSAQPAPRLLTVAEYEQIPDPPGGRYELHHGEAVFVTYPVQPHKTLQRRLRKLLEPIMEPLGFIVDTEYPYRPLPENEVWGADVACVSAARIRSEKKWLKGSPELVIEVKSPSNSKSELNDKAMTMLAGESAVEFWIVYPKTRTLTVFNKTGLYTYAVGNSVTVPLSNAILRLADVFEGRRALNEQEDTPVLSDHRRASGPTIRMS